MSDIMLSKSDVDALINSNLSHNIKSMLKNGCRWLGNFPAEDVNRIMIVLKENKD